VHPDPTHGPARSPAPFTPQSIRRGYAIDPCEAHRLRHRRPAPAGCDASYCGFIDASSQTVGIHLGSTRLCGCSDGSKAGVSSRLIPRSCCGESLNEDHDHDGITRWLRQCGGANGELRQGSIGVPRRIWTCGRDGARDSALDRRVDPGAPVPQRADAVGGRDFRVRAHRYPIPMIVEGKFKPIRGPTIRPECRLAVEGRQNYYVARANHWRNTSPRVTTPKTDAQTLKVRRAPVAPMHASLARWS